MKDPKTETIQTPRDTGFKIVLGNHELFARFLLDFIKLDCFKDVQASQIIDVSERYLSMYHENKDSDTVKMVHIPGQEKPYLVITIVEHESRVNHRAAFKMLLYMVLAWDQFEKDENVKAGKAISRHKDFTYGNL